MKAAVVILALALGVAGCSGLSSPEIQRILREKSAEIGAKDVVVFEMRRRAADKLIEACLSKISTPVENSIDCVRAALKLVS